VTAQTSSHPAPGYTVRVKGTEPKVFSCPECLAGMCDCLYAAKAWAQAVVLRTNQAAVVLSPTGIELIRLERVK
jgi:hypothetical protein